MFDNPQDATKFAVAGNATVTLESLKTGAHYTFKIQAPTVATEANGRTRDLAAKVRFVKLLTAPDTYTYLGMIRDVASPHVTLTLKSAYKADSAPIRALNYLFDHADKPTMPSGLVVRHDGRCGRCQRPLTVPESIDTGFGPECSAYLGIQRINKARLGPQPGAPLTLPTRKPVFDPAQPPKWLAK